MVYFGRHTPHNHNEKKNSIMDGVVMTLRCIDSPPANDLHIVQTNRDFFKFTEQIRIRGYIFAQLHSNLALDIDLVKLSDRNQVGGFSCLL